MEITIIDGSPSDKYASFQKAINDTKEKLSENHQVDLFTINQMHINYCVGCFGCWVKTPGQCHLKDEAETVLRSAFKTDLLIIASPIIAGLISSESKKILDRMLPKVMPYIGIYHGESHHHNRYKNTFDLGLLLFEDECFNKEIAKINFDIFDRLILNFHADKVIKMTATSDNLMEVINHEISIS